MDGNNVLEIVATSLGIIATIGGGIAWYASIVRKRYAAERDFQHIRSWQVTTSTYLDNEFSLLRNRLDKVDDTLIEMKAVFYSERIGRNAQHNDNQSS